MPESVEEYLVKDGILKALDRFAEDNLDSVEGLAMLFLQLSFV